MSVDSSNSTATGIVQPDTQRETYIGWSEWSRQEATGYWPADYIYPKKSEYYKHLDEIDAGRKNGFWYNEKHLRHHTNRDIISNLSGHLGLTGEQQDRAKRYFLSQDLSRWGIQIEYVAWAVCAYLVHSNEANDRKCHPQTAEEDYDELVYDAALSFGMKPEDFASVYGKVESDFR